MLWEYFGDGGMVEQRNDMAVFRRLDSRADCMAAFWMSYKGLLVNKRVPTRSQLQSSSRHHAEHEFELHLLRDICTSS